MSKTKHKFVKIPISQYFEMFDENGKIRFVNYVLGSNNVSNKVDYITIGLKAYFLGLSSEAKKLFFMHLKENPNSWEAYCNLGAISEDKNETQLEYYKTALKHCPDYEYLPAFFLCIKYFDLKNSKPFLRYSYEVMIKIKKTLQNKQKSLFLVKKDSFSLLWYVCVAFTFEKFISYKEFKQFIEVFCNFLLDNQSDLFDENVLFDFDTSRINLGFRGSDPIVQNMVLMLDSLYKEIIYSKENKQSGQEFCDIVIALIVFVNESEDYKYNLDFKKIIFHQFLSTLKKTIEPNFDIIDVKFEYKEDGSLAKTVPYPLPELISIQ